MVKSSIAATGCDINAALHSENVSVVFSTQRDEAAETSTLCSSRKSGRATLSLVFAGVLTLFATGAENLALAQTQTLPTQGCPQSHCNQANTDFANLPIPPAGGSIAPDIVWTKLGLRGEDLGSFSGLGCSANGVFAVCSYIGSVDDPESLEKDTVVAYEYDGTRMWQSNDLLNGSAFTSAPLIIGDNDEPSTIAVDNKIAIRFESDGGIEWDTLHNSGSPISPALLDSNIVILAGQGDKEDETSAQGLITAIDNDDDLGPIVGTYTVREVLTDYFETSNTPAVKGDRFYISMQQRDANDALAGLAWLVALDWLPPDGTNLSYRIEKAWHYSFNTDTVEGVGSLSSPLLMEVATKDILFFRRVPRSKWSG